MSEVRLACANGALLAVPAWENHARGSNWLAVVDINGLLPGGLSRKWLPRAKGECFYLVSDLALFDAVEFGADYTTGVGKKKPNRWYGVVIAKTDDLLVLQEADTGAAAVMLAKSHRTSPEWRAAALHVERAALLAHAEKLRREAEALTAVAKEEGP